MDRFDEVEALDTDALRRLLTEGTERERVWAAWALGLRLGTQARPDLARASRREPDPGARRHLAVLLAGYRDLDLLAVMARHDPDGYVRASACQYLATVAPDSPAVRALLRERLAADTFPPVRSTILQHLLGVGEEDIAELARAAADTELEVRSAALEALSRLGARAAPVLCERFRDESDFRLREALLRQWSAAADALALLEECVLLPVERAREVLDLLARREHTFEWERLAPLATRREAVLDVAVLRCLRRQEASAEVREWWADLILRGYDPWAHLPTCEAARLALRFLVEALRPLRGEALGLGERERLARVREYLEALRAPDPDEEDSEDDEEDLYEDEEGWGPGPVSELLELLRQHSR